MLKLRYIPLILICTVGSIYAQQMTSEAFEETKAACEKQNDGAACSKLYYYYISAKRYYLRGLPKDTTKALYYAKQGCELGDEDGCFSAGMMLYYGDEQIPANKGEGRKLLKKACDLGKEDVCTYFLNPNF